ncbi:MAG: transporter substrate-binding domain-containing protein [Clostridia bacterium]|nr:transporter substrate-binding domain-containing protein [Clostridia bacterium]
MKKLLILFLTLIMSLNLVGCKRGSDLEEVKKANKLVVGITYYEPMNYKVEGEWTGFDTEFARLFAEELGVEIEFKEISWQDRLNELTEYNIDCIWNAMSILEQHENFMSFSNPYILNGQVVIMNTENAKKYSDSTKARRLKFAAEEKSAASNILLEEGYTNKQLVKTQYAALDAIVNGTADAAIVDIIFADAVMGKGKKYEDLVKTYTCSGENCAVGFRLDSDLIDPFNEFLEEIRDTKLIDLANKYGLTLC